MYPAGNVQLITTLTHLVANSLPIALSKPTFVSNSTTPEVTIDTHRRSLAKLRSSNNKLSIETGRYTRPIIPRNERVCSACRSGEIECHFLQVCNCFSDLRSSHISPHIGANVARLPAALRVGYILKWSGCYPSSRKCCHLAIPGLYCKRFFPVICTRV
jgi:hypothetical protein